MLFIVFKILGWISSEKKNKGSTFAPNAGTSSNLTSTANRPVFDEAINDKAISENDEELVAVISAAISCYNSGPFRIKTIKEVGTKSSEWKKHTDKTWRKMSKGDTKRW